MTATELMRGKRLNLHAVFLHPEGIEDLTWALVGL